MSQVARDLARRLVEAGIDAADLAAAVIDVAAARAEATNAEGLRAQVEFLLEAYGPGEIEELANAQRQDGRAAMSEPAGPVDLRPIASPSGPGGRA
jgi:thioredoxin-like negative regulator of GroEL